MDSWNRGGKFEDLQTAINEANKYINYSDKSITIKLISDLVINEFINIVNIHSPFLNIDFNDYSIILNNASYDTGFSMYNSILGNINKLKINCNNKSINTAVLLQINSFCCFYDMKGILNCLGNAFALSTNSAAYVFGSTCELSAGSSGYFSKGITSVGSRLLFHTCKFTQNSGALSQSVETSGIIDNYNTTFSGSITGKSQVVGTWTKNGFISA
ncbi:receptor binding protein 3 [Campylobacter phage F207]|uniref:Receptor binding protein 3 n=1 Tax=Campylobacter phage F207 TaxID=2794360 RepID=A0A7T3KCZ2_9CAUD|nr:receptor binding protein 3 [Campylobacter phage F207]